MLNRFHPDNYFAYISFLRGEHSLIERIHFIEEMETSEEYLATYAKERDTLIAEGEDIYRDEAKYLDDLCLGQSKTSHEDIHSIHSYIEKLKSLDPVFAEFAKKETLVIQATMEVLMRDEIAQAVNEEQLITEAENFKYFTDAEELETEEPTIHAMETPSFKDAIMDFMSLKNSDIEEDSDEDKDEDEESDEKDKADEDE